MRAGNIAIILHMDMSSKTTYNTFIEANNIVLRISRTDQVEKAEGACTPIKSRI